MADKFANQAVFILQMRSAEAMRYIRKNAGCTTEAAEAAFRSTVMFHKSK